MGKKRVYVGLLAKNTLVREVFRSVSVPTEDNYPRYALVIGPFQTVRGAKCMVHYGGHNNPHIRCVADAERIGKKYADDLALLGETNERSKPEPINNEIGGPNDYAYGM